MIIDKVYNFLRSKYDITPRKVAEGIKYLKDYGYLDKSLGDYTINEIIAAVVKFQELAGLTPDGEMGPKTLGVMNWPRCQMPDMDNGKPFSMAKTSGKWGKKNLTYYIGGYDDLSESVWAEEIKAAFDAWTEVCDLKFSRVSSANQANIAMYMGSGKKDQFDGPGGTLAWMYLVPSVGYTGQVTGKFDSGEKWTTVGGSGIILRAVACHEIGHALCLYHSDVSSALMAPFYSSRVLVPQKNDDISRIQAVYGKPTTTPTPPIPPTPPTPPNPGEPVTEITIKIGNEITKLDMPGYYRVTKLS